MVATERHANARQSCVMLCVQGLDSRLVSRWPEYQIQAQTIEIRATDSLARFEHAVVLKNVMTQISGLQASLCVPVYMCVCLCACSALIHTG